MKRRLPKDRVKVFPNSRIPEGFNNLDARNMQQILRKAAARRDTAAYVAAWCKLNRLMEV